MGKKNRYQRKYSTSSGVNYLLYVFLIILFYPPYFRGLFFNQQLLITHILTALLMLAVIYFESNKEPFEFLASPIEYIALILLIIYIITGVGAVIPREAVKETLKLVNYILIFYLAGYFARSKEDVKLIFKAMYFSSIGVAIIGILAFVGAVEIRGAIIDGRISSTIQYPNTLAVYMAALFIVGIYLYVTEEKKHQKILISISNYIVFLAFLGAQSRGGVIILPVSVLFMLAGPLKKYRWIMLLQMLQSMIIAGIVYSLSLDTNTERVTDNMILTIISGVAIVAVLYVVCERISVRLKNSEVLLKGSIRHIVITIVAFVIIGSLVGLIKTSDERVIPAFERISKTSLQERNVQERLIFYKDALKVVKEKPLLGYGGGGWEGVYKQYSSYAYNSNMVHNYFLQVMVEVGIIGVAVYLIALFCFIYTIIRNIYYAKDDEIKALNWIILTSAMTILMHSMIDFNLAMGAIAIFLWSLFGLASGMDRLNEKRLSIFNLKINTRQKATRLVASILITIFVFISGLLYLGNVYGERGLEKYNARQFMQAKNDLERAIKYDFLDSDYRMALADIYLRNSGENRNPEGLKIALDYAKDAVRLNYYNPETHKLKGNVHLYMGQAMEGVGEYEKALELDPTKQQRYEELANISLKAGKYFAYLGKNEEAKRYFEKVIKIPQLIQEKARTMSVSEKMPWVKEEYSLYISDGIKDTISEAEQNLAKL